MSQRAFTHHAQAHSGGVCGVRGVGEVHAALRPAARRTALLLTLTLALAGGVLTARPTPAAGATPEPRPRLGECAAGRLCLWAGGGFEGERRTYELTDVDIESCVPLPPDLQAASFANRTGHPVTLYQSGECAETAEFRTYPTGSWTPESDYRVRGFKIWEH